MPRIQLPSATRRQILDRDGRRCQRCFRTGSLAIHHIIAVRENGSNAEENLITLCVPCHEEWHVVQSTVPLSFAVWREMPPAGVILWALTDSLVHIPEDCADPLLFVAWRARLQDAWRDITIAHRAGASLYGVKNTPKGNRE